MQAPPPELGQMSMPKLWTRPSHLPHDLGLDMTPHTFDELGVGTCKRIDISNAVVDSFMLVAKMRLILRFPFPDGSVGRYRYAWCTP